MNKINIIFFSKIDPFKEAIVFNGKKSFILKNPLSNIDKEAINLTNLNYEELKELNINLPNCIKSNYFFGTSMESISLRLGVFDSVEQSLIETYRVSKELIEDAINFGIVSFDDLLKSRQMPMAIYDQIINNNVIKKNHYLSPLKVNDIVEKYEANMNDINFTLKLSYYSIAFKILESLSQDFKMISNDNIRKIKHKGILFKGIPNRLSPFFKLKSATVSSYGTDIIGDKWFLKEKKFDIPILDRVIISEKNYNNEKISDWLGKLNTIYQGSMFYEFKAKIIIDYLLLENEDNFNKNIIKAVFDEQVALMINFLDDMKGVKIKNVSTDTIKIAIHKDDLTNNIISDINEYIMESNFLNLVRTTN